MSEAHCVAPVASPQARIASTPSPPLRIRLRLLDETDRDLYHALHASPEVMRAIGPPLAAGEIEARFGRVLRHNRAATPGHRAWAIESATNAIRFGFTALSRDGARAEFGIMLLPTAQRRGIATAAIAELLPHAFGPMALARVDASRPDDAFVPVIDAMFAPFGFRRCRGLRAGETGWSLSRASGGATGRAPDPGRCDPTSGPEMRHAVGAAARKPDG